MTLTKVEVLKDSIGPNFNSNHRLITLKCKFAMLVAKEVLTHRAFSRNSESSRAVPVTKKLKQETYCPDVFGKKAKGMQSKGELSKLRNWLARRIWLTMASINKTGSWLLDKLGTAKQHANRSFEWCSYVEMVITADIESWNHFLSLRDHPDAQPEIQDLARKVRKAINESIPEVLNYGSWHLPYDVDPTLLFNFKDGIRGYTLEERKLISIGKVAGISYVSDMEHEKAMNLAIKLKNHVPIHASPMEHIAQCRPYGMKYANFNGWMSERYKLENIDPYVKEMEDDAC